MYHCRAPAYLAKQGHGAYDVVAVRASFEAMKQHYQGRVHRALQPVDVDEIAIVQFPALAPVGNRRAGKKIGIDGLGMAAPQPHRGDIRSCWLNGYGVVAVSVPLDLAAAGKALASGFNLLYTRHFLDTLKRKAIGKLDLFPDLFDPAAVSTCTTLYEFDNLVTAPLHGFRNAEDYWNQSSSKPWLKYIEVPTLIVNAINDPFMPPHALPRSADVSSMVTLEYPDEGGHVGFLDSPFPGRLTWLPERIVSFFGKQGSRVVLQADDAMPATQIS